MSYIGRGIDQIDNISTLDNLSFNGSSTTFNLTQNSVAFVPVSADALQIQIDGIIQSGNYSISGSTVTFNFTPSGSSVCNGIKHFGVGVAFTPADSSITKDKTNFISNSSSSGITSKGDGGSVDGSIALNCSQNSHHTKISSASHSSYSGNLNFVLPSSHGTTGQLMKTDGSGNLSFVDAPSSSYVLISNYNVSSTVSTITFSSVFSATYKNYFLVFSNVKCSATGMTNLNFLSGSTNHNTWYGSAMTGYRSNNGTSNYGSYGSGISNANIHSATNSIADKGVSFLMWFLDPQSSAIKRMSTTGAYENSSNYHTTFNSMNLWDASASVDGFVLSRSSGDFYGHGQVTLYGVKNA